MSDAPKDHRLQDVLAYRQGFLEGPRLAEFEAHLRDCASCQATLEGVSRFLPAVQQTLTTPKLPSTPELWATMQAQSRAQRETKKPRRNLLGLRIGMAAAAVSAAAVIFLVARPLLQGEGPEVVMGAPHPPQSPAPDGGVDAGEVP
jgi:predicted anti-sigma-YlaC factor YlaD